MYINKLTVLFTTNNGGLFFNDRCARDIWQPSPKLKNISSETNNLYKIARI